MPRLTDDHQINTFVVKRYPLRRSSAQVDFRQGSRKGGPHAGKRLDGNHATAGQYELPSEFASARGKIENSRSRVDSESARNEVDRFGRITRSGAFVEISSLGRRPRVLENVHFCHLFAIVGTIGLVQIISDFARRFEAS
jgi:hypothetical protein